MDKIFLFIVDNIGNLLSLNSITKVLRNSGLEVNTGTLTNYLKYLEEVFLVSSAQRYDLKGKRILEGEKKYYISDLGFRNFFSSGFDPGLGKKLENYVYWTLRRAGYQVYIGNINGVEVDFIAEKLHQKIYIQATYLLNSEDVIEREYKSLEMINDHWPKIIVSMDDFQFNPKNGIRHFRVWDWTCTDVA